MDRVTSQIWTHWRQEKVSWLVSWLRKVLQYTGRGNRKWKNTWTWTRNLQLRPSVLSLLNHDHLIPRPLWWSIQTHHLGQQNTMYVFKMSYCKGNVQVGITILCSNRPTCQVGGNFHWVHQTSHWSSGDRLIAAPQSLSASLPLALRVARACGE